MKQMSLKLNTYVKNVSAINNNIERLVLHIIFWSFGALAFFYIFLLGNMVRNIIERQSLEARALPLSNEVRSLESTYLSISNNIDLPLSYSMGFKETEATFATRKALGLNSTGEPLGNVKVAQNDL
jgi:hypothetical protein